MTAVRVVTFGEGMIELNGGNGDALAVGTGGDMLNAAVAFARAGCTPRFLTAVGSDPWSTALLARWASEGVDTSIVARHATRLPGIYAISTDAQGERSFGYWRERSAARAFWSCVDLHHVVDQLADAHLLLLSGITLSLFDADGRTKVVALLQRLRDQKTLIAFDPNYRASGWRGAEAANFAFDAVARQCDIALPGRDDELALGHSPQPAAIADRWRAFGVRDVVVKLGAAGAWADGEQIAPKPGPVVDTTGAGDAFDAGYCAARLRGSEPRVAVEHGQQLAARAIAVNGGLITGR